MKRVECAPEWNFQLGFADELIRDTFVYFSSSSTKIFALVASVLAPCRSFMASACRAWLKNSRTCATVFFLLAARLEFSDCNRRSVVAISAFVCLRRAGLPAASPSESIPTKELASGAGGAGAAVDAGLVVDFGLWW